MNDCKTVTLRTRPLKNRMLSFYLDYYPGYRDKETMKVIRHESLGIYIYANPKNKREQDFNEVMAEKAEAIRCRRFESVVNERYDFFDKYKLKADFLEYFRNSRLISWSISVISSVNMTQSGNLSISISATSCMENVLLRSSTLISATSSVSTC